jgi:hypothetical protein
MTKKKAATTKSASPALIVFGAIDGKYRAGTFSEAEAALAKKAAAELGLSVLDVDNKSKRDLATKLSAGRVHANASRFVPIAPRAVYALLTDGPAEPVKGKDSEPHLPKSFQDIGVGSLVASQDSDPADGYWLAVVTKQKGDMLTLRWKSSSDRRIIIKHRYSLGLLWPGEDLPVAPDDAKNETYPANWQLIGVNSVVIAVEDGPARQLWQATVIEATGPDTFKLKWRDSPDVPAIERPRHSLVLMYPNPGAVKRSKKS